MSNAAPYAGQRIPRVEDARLLTGHGTYVDDIFRPGMLHACFVRSPFARARIRAIDSSEALALPGVRAVFTAADLNPPTEAGKGDSLFGLDVPSTPNPPLAEGQVCFVGDPLAMVVAENRYIAEDAAELVSVDFEPLEAVVDYRSADSSDELVHAAFPGNVVGVRESRTDASVEEAFDRAAHVVGETIVQQAYVAVPMEGRGIVAEWFAASKELNIWSSTQSAHEIRSFCAGLLALPEHSIRVMVRDTGGAFGQKMRVTREEMCVMLAARKVPSALKWVEDRRENLIAAGLARHECGDVSMAFDDGGAIMATRIDYLQDAGAYPVTWPVAPGMTTVLLFPGPYRVPEASFRAKFVFSNMPGRGAYRGPWQFESLAREVLLDIAARRMGIDPVELRRRNLIRRDDLPYKNPNGLTYDSITPLETFEKSLEILDYEEFRRQQAEARTAGRYLGVGTASYVEPTTTGAGTFGTEGATIRIEPSGAINVYVAGGSAGNSLETTVVQLAADALSVDLADVHTIQGDTAVTPFGAGTGGSRSAGMTAGAITEASAVLRDKIVAIAAHRLEAAQEDIELVQGQARVRGTPSSSISYADIARLAYIQSAELPPGVSPGLEASARYATRPGWLWANATHVCTCEVDLATGAVKILRYIVSEDCGPMINPNVVEGQIAGGTVQGIGGVLFEHLAYDSHGNPVATSFLDYLLPTATEIPTIEYGHIETPSPGVGGYKGVGEGGAIGAPPAVVNAIADALAPLGVTITRMPLDPARIVELIETAITEGRKKTEGLG